MLLALAAALMGKLKKDNLFKFSISVLTAIRIILN